LGEDIVVVTERNRPVAAIVPLKHVDRESLALSTHPEFLDLIARALREFAAGKTPSFEEMKKAVLPLGVANKRLERTLGKRGSTARRKAGEVSCRLHLTSVTVYGNGTRWERFGEPATCSSRGRGTIPLGTCMFTAMENSS
jgi:hypothetical protein